MIQTVFPQLGHSHGGHGVEDIAAANSEGNIVDKEGTIEGAESRHLLNSHQDRAMQMAELEAEESLMMHTPRQKRGKAESNRKGMIQFSAKNGGGDHLNMRAVFLHVVSDAVGSVIVMVTALVSWQVTGYEWLKLYMDPSLRFIKSNFVSNNF